MIWSKLLLSLVLLLVFGCFLFAISDLGWVGRNVKKKKKDRNRRAFITQDQSTNGRTNENIRLKMENKMVRKNKTLLPNFFADFSWSGIGVTL